MKLGVATVVTDEGIRPDVLAKALKDGGFDSLTVAEHSHVPTSRVTPSPAGGELPREYYRLYDPFVELHQLGRAGMHAHRRPLVSIPASLCGTWADRANIPNT